MPYESITTDVQEPDVSYRACAFNAVPAALATDLFTLTGSATKIVRIYEVGVSGVRTTATNTIFRLQRRSSIDSGGTSSVVPTVAFDPAGAAATAVARVYTVNPLTLGTLIGSIQDDYLFVPTLTTQGASQYIWLFGLANRKPVILRQASDVFAINLNGATIAGGLLNVWAAWTEE